MTRQLTFHKESYRYDFRPPQWRPRAQLNTQIGTLLFVTLLWLAATGTLIGYLFAQDRRLTVVVLALSSLLILAGALVISAWRRLVVRWVRRYRHPSWPALSRNALYRLTPSEFEEYVAERLFARHGYAVENTQESHDGGVDILVQDASGRRAIVQCKRYRGTVGTPAVRDLYGTVLHNQADMGYLVATGKISSAARGWVAGKPIVLIDGDRLMRLSRAEPEPPSNASH